MILDAERTFISFGQPSAFTYPRVCDIGDIGDILDLRVPFCHNVKLSMLIHTCILVCVVNSVFVISISVYC